MKDLRLFSYKLANDSGFAPNPFWGVLTLATCKPKIRESKLKGDWIAGFTSRKLNGDQVGSERLIYLMQVTDKILISEYWNNPAYEKKKPLPDAGLKNSVGDNIYRPLVEVPISPDDFEQIPNRSHKENNRKKDLSGRYVLVSKKFWYFGKNPVEIPPEIRPVVPPGQSSQGHQTKKIERAAAFITYIENNYKNGIHSDPTDWKNHEPGCAKK